MTTRRVALLSGGYVRNEWDRVSIVRDMEDIAGSFSVTAWDQSRMERALPYISFFMPILERIRPGQDATITIDGEPVLVGWIDQVRTEFSDGAVSITITGRDKTGDLVDCAAAPEGPVEYKGLNALQIAERICAPFDIAVRADVDPGEPFDRFAIDVAETAMSVMDKAARQRQLVILSDGVGGLLLTRTGKNLAPKGITVPGDAISAQGTFDHSSRFSAYYVKGQAEKAGGKRGDKAALDATAEPLGTESAPQRAPAQTTPKGNKESAGVTLQGLARDDQIKRYRPTIITPRTQSTDKSIQDQAEWAMRVARGKSETVSYSLPDWRSGDELWRPNWLAPITDLYNDIARTMVLAAVTFEYGDQGERASLRFCDQDAFDMEFDAKRGQNRKDPKGSRGAKESKPLDSTAERL